MALTALLAQRFAATRDLRVCAGRNPIIDLPTSFAREAGGEQSSVPIVPLVPLARGCTPSDAVAETGTAAASDRASTRDSERAT